MTGATAARCFASRSVNSPSSALRHRSSQPQQPYLSANTVDRTSTTPYRRRTPFQSGLRAGSPPVAVRSVTAGHTENIQGGRNINVTGAYARSVDGAVDDFNKGARSVTVDGNLEHGVTGTHAAFSTGEMSLGSGAVLKLGVGGSGIEINNGEITITSNGSTVKINAGGVTVNGAKIDLN